MKLHADKPGSSHYIQRCEAGSVQIGGRLYRSPVIVAADQLIADWLPPPLPLLGVEHFQAALGLEPEVILFGTGTAHLFPDPRLIHAIVSRGVGFEVMNTGAACRTYNVLLAEDRRVVAALLLP